MGLSATWQQQGVVCQGASIGTTVVGASWQRAEASADRFHDGFVRRQNASVEGEHAVGQELNGVLSFDGRNPERIVYVPRGDDIKGTVGCGGLGSGMVGCGREPEEAVDLPVGTHGRRDAIVDSFLGGLA